MREPAADRFEVRLFQRPQLDELGGTLPLRTRIELCELRDREVALRDVAAIGDSLDTLDIDADLRIMRDGASDETVRVGEVERERRRAEFMRERRLSIRIGHERPRVRVAIVVHREDAAEQRMPRGEIAAVTPKNEPLTADPLILRELRHLGPHRVVVERFREAIPDVGVAGSEGVGTQAGGRTARFASPTMIATPTCYRAIRQRAGNVRSHFQRTGAGADASRRTPLFHRHICQSLTATQGIVRRRSALCVGGLRPWTATKLMSRGLTSLAGGDVGQGPHAVTPPVLNCGTSRASLYI
jgi:hypothetical protein